MAAAGWWRMMRRSRGKEQDPRGMAEGLAAFFSRHPIGAGARTVPVAEAR